MKECERIKQKTLIRNPETQTTAWGQPDGKGVGVATWWAAKGEEMGLETFLG